MKTLSIVVPVYNESDNIIPFYDNVKKVMPPLQTSYNYEIIFVDDGSTDGSRELFIQLEQNDSRVQPIFLAKNSGHQLALTCGLDYATGDVVITMDGDLQHPPSLIPELLSLWESGYEIVQTIRQTTEGVSWFKKHLSSLYYYLLNKISAVPVTPGGSDFRLLSRQALIALRRFREHDRFLRGIVSLLGFRKTTLYFVAPARNAGISKFSSRKMLNLAFDGIFSCSITPLRLGLYLGFASTIGIFLLFGDLLVSKYLNGDAAPGWSATVSLLLLFGGMQLITLGFIGEYIARIF